MPKLSYVGVEGLLGRFKHEVNFDPDWEFVILHGPNGVGKTKLLELIHSVLSVQLERLKRLPFDSAELRYDDGSSIAVGHGGQERLPVGDVGARRALDLPRGCRAEAIDISTSS